ncbi:hypothetical protein ACH347_21100 [Saccharopolyspora sp. 5N102]|uniref:hypothetical protein n=1 Tax=Saccharopolyspora sp. 5N102 TaxID=3375155 RepID=UPI0037B54211
MSLEGLMTPPAPAFTLEVVADGNAILGERLTRSLRAELNEIADVEVEFADSTTATAAGAKGGLAADLALWVFLGGAGVKALTPVVVAGIKAWSERERNRKVRLTRGDETLEIQGKPDAAQERIVTKFLEGGDV